MQIAQDFLSRAPAENPAHSGLCKGFSTGAVGRKDKQDVQVIFEQFLRNCHDITRTFPVPSGNTSLCLKRHARGIASRHMLKLFIYGSLGPVTN